MTVSSVTVLASGLDHPEGVAWDPAGSLVAGGEAGQLYRVDIATGAVTLLAETGGAVLGIALDAAGRLTWCDQHFAEVRRFDPADGSVRTVSTGAPDRRFAVPNFPVFHESGRLYVSDSGAWPAQDGAILAIEPDGATRVVSTQARAFTNGLAIDPTGGWLYAVETSLPGISRMAILPDGSLGDLELVVEMPRTVPDGLAFAADGRLLVSCFRPDAIFVWDGRAIGSVAEDWSGLSLSAPTNICFFGRDLDRLACANIAFRHLSEVVTGMTGAPLRYPDVP
jgi:gluconolactonase